MTRKEVYKLIEQHYRQNKDKLIDIYYRRIGNYHVAEEVVQEGYTLACEYWSSYNPEFPLDPWMNQILTNATKKALRVERKHGMGLNDDVEPDTLLSPSASPELTTYAKEMLDRITDEPRGTMLRLHLLDGMTEREVAIKLGCSQVWVNRVVRNFKEKMADEDSNVRHRDKRIAPCRGHGVVCSS